MYNFLKLTFLLCFLASCQSQKTRDEMIAAFNHYYETLKDDPVTTRRSIEMQGVIIRERSQLDE